MSSTTFFNILSSFVGIRAICPSHLNLLALIQLTTSNVLVSGVASSCLVLPVMCVSIAAFAPLSILHVASFSVQASDPYTNIEQTADL